MRQSTFGFHLLSCSGEGHDATKWMWWPQCDWKTVICNNDPFIRITFENPTSRLILSRCPFFFQANCISKIITSWTHKPSTMDGRATMISHQGGLFQWIPGKVWVKWSTNRPNSVWRWWKGYRIRAKIPWSEDDGKDKTICFLEKCRRPKRKCDGIYNCVFFQRCLCNENNKGCQSGVWCLVLVVYQLPCCSLARASKYFNYISNWFKLVDGTVMDQHWIEV